MTDEPIYVTRPSLPPLEDVVALMEGIWDRRILTNGGPLHEQLEQELCDYLGVKHISLFANGTLALLIALKALRLQGEVITTPFSFVATSEALSWNGLEPVFADIQECSFGLDPASIEASITPRTTAILAVHCYGFPCDVEAIQGQPRGVDLMRPCRRGNPWAWAASQPSGHKCVTTGAQVW